MTERAAPADTVMTVQLTEQVVQLHQASVWRYLRFLGCDPGLADDLAQETFLALAASRLPNKGAAALNGWLRGTAHNLVRARHRQMRRELRHATAAQTEATWQGYSRQDEGTAYREALRGCLTLLSDREQDALERRYTHRESREAIATVLGIGLEGVKSLLRRAKESLRTCIEAKTQ